MGQKRIAVYKMLYPHGLDANAFQSLFEEELDSAFTADLACCESCLSEYTKRWPGLRRALESEAFPLRLFYTGGGFDAFYTLDEFLEMCRQMGCPQCGAPLEGYLYPYNHRFDVPKAMEGEIDELEALATRTPFLVLRHALAQRVFDEIEKIKVTAVPLVDAVFRARPITVARTADQFLAPPAPLCGEGRYNHAGRPVLYVASSPRVAFAEIGSPPEGCLVAKLNLRHPQRILDLGSDDLPSDILQAVTASSLLSAPAAGKGWEKPEYSFSRFVADCAVDADFTSLRYPSVAYGGGFNLVVFEPPGGWADAMEIEELIEFHPSK